MFPALPRLLPRACRGFTSRVAVFNEFPPAYSVTTPHPRPGLPSSRPYDDLVIPAAPTRDTWGNHPMTGQVVEPSIPAAEKWKIQSRNVVAALRAHPPADAYQGLP